MTELSWEEFKKTYLPKKQNERKGLERYLLPVFEKISVKVKGDKEIVRQLLTNRPNFKKVLAEYDMFVWTLMEDNKLVSGRKIADAVGYILCSIHHEDEVTVNIYRKEDE